MLSFYLSQRLSIMSTVCIIRPVVGVSVLTWCIIFASQGWRWWFIKYIYYWNLLLLNNVIIIKTKVSPLQVSHVTLADFSYLVFQSFDFVMDAILEKCCAHQIRYLPFCDMQLLCRILMFAKPALIFLQHVCLLP